MDRDKHVVDKHIPALRAWIERLTGFGHQAFSHLTYSGDAPFMALTFVARQLAHAKAVMVLEGHRDADLIVRTMLEGMCALKWSMGDAERPRKWRLFVSVQTWRNLKQLEEAGHEVAPEQRQSIDEALAEHGEVFYTEKARKAKAAGRPLPVDPYQFNWTGTTVRQVFEEVLGDQLYKQPYAFYSDWQHWSPLGLMRAIDFGDEATEYTDAGPLDTASAYATAIQSLLETFDVASHVAAPQLVASVNHLKTSYVTDYGGLARDLK